MPQVLTAEQKLSRWEDTREIKNLVGRMSTDYVLKEERIAAESAMIQAAFPKKLGEKSAGEVHGVGMIDYKPVDTGVIEVAGDGQTAKGLWYCWGSQAQVLSCGPTASWTWGYYAADFVREGNGWKLWHLQITNDVDARCGTDWGQPAQPLPELPEFAPLKDFAMPAYSMARPNRVQYSGRRPLTGSPRIPEPYHTFADTFSYGV